MTLDGIFEHFSFLKELGSCLEVLGGWFVVRTPFEETRIDGLFPLLLSLASCFVGRFPLHLLLIIQSLAIWALPRYFLDFLFCHLREACTLAMEPWIKANLQLSQESHPTEKGSASSSTPKRSPHFRQKFSLCLYRSAQFTHIDLPSLVVVLDASIECLQPGQIVIFL